jgi:hypothetical protein
VKTRLAAVVRHLDALSQRDRLTLAAGFVALLVGVEAMLVLPLQDRRRMIEQAQAAQLAAHSEAQAAALQQMQAHLAQLHERSVRLARDLAALGWQDSPPRSPGRFIAAALQGSGVELVALHGLPVEVLSAVLAAAADAAAAAAAAATGETATVETAVPALPLFYRHRAELRLQGPLAQLMQALQVLEEGATAMRVESVRIAPGDSGQPLQATVVLTTINQERTWFAL